jgi:hypothetical protein
MLTVIDPMVTLLPEVPVGPVGPNRQRRLLFPRFWQRKKLVVVVIVILIIVYFLSYFFFFGASFFHQITTQQKSERGCLYVGFATRLASQRDEINHSFKKNKNNFTNKTDEKK